MRFLSASFLDREVSTFQGDFPRLQAYPISKKNSLNPNWQILENRSSLDDPKNCQKFQFLQTVLLENSSMSGLTHAPIFDWMSFPVTRFSSFLGNSPIRLAFSVKSSASQKILNFRDSSLDFQTSLVPLIRTSHS